MRRFATILLLAGTALAASLPAQAQVNPFRSSTRSGLTNEDIGIMQQAAQELASSPDTTVGSSKPWGNDRTGANGSVTVKSKFKHKGMSCYKVDYQAQSKHWRSPRSTFVSWCKAPQGWRML
jgi:hypothetical protein